MELKNKGSKKGPINGVYNLGPVLGRGGFSSVYLATDNHGKRYAVKTEKRIKQKFLIKEREVYMKFHEKAKKKNVYPVGFPRMHHFDEDFHGDRVVVMDCLGKSLGDILSWRRTPFPIKTVLMVGIQAVSRLESLHGVGVVHRDIKPDNLLTGVGKQRNLIYLSDFGLADEYIDEMGQHVSNSTTRGFSGTRRYASIQAHNHTRQSRRSDLESLAYTLVYLGRKKLPWSSVPKRNSRVYAREVARIKATVSARRLCKGLPSVFAEFVRYVKGLGFYQKPDYERLRNLLDGELKRRRERNDGEFHWLQG